MPRTYRKLEVSTAPVEDILTTAELKSYLRVEFSDDDTLIDALRDAAFAHVRDICRRPILTTVYKLYLDSIPSEKLELPFYKELVSVDDVSWFNTSDSETSFSSSDYDVDLKSNPRRLDLGDLTLDSTAREVNPLCVTFTAGASAANAPEGLKLAVKSLVAYWYENRLPVSFARNQKLPYSFEALLNQYRYIEV